MSDINYKEYTPEESAVYETAIAKIREALQAGLSFDDACKTTDITDTGLRFFVEDDALKIMIAEMHFGAGMPLPDFAGKMKLPMKKVNKAVVEMLQDAGVSAAEIYRQDGEDGPVGHA